MAAKSNLRNMVLCLGAVCLVCSALLAGVNALTEAPIKEAAEKALKESIGAVLPQGGELSEERSVSVGDQIYVYYECTLAEGPACYAVKSTVQGFGGPLTLMVGVLGDLTINNTSVLSHSETPGLGAKCATDEGFMNQWKGFNGVLKVRKDGGDVDAITASTITSRAYTLAVEQAVEAVKAIQAQNEQTKEETNG